MVKNAKQMGIPERNSFLLLGPPGSGKTTQIFTMPCRGFMFGFDANIEQAIRGADVDYELIQPDRLDIDVHPLSSKKQEKQQIVTQREPKAYIEWERIYDKLAANGTLDRYPFIWMDSFSSFSDMVMDRVQWLNGRLGKHPEQADYTSQMHTIHNVARDLAYRKKIFIATGHEKETIKQIRSGNETVNVSTWSLYLTGQLRLKVPSLFSNIYRFEANRDRYSMISVSDSAHRYIRNSIRGVPPVLDVTIKDWEHPSQYGLGRILVEGGYLPGPAFKTSILQKPGLLASKTQPKPKGR